jgi:hypothetical protein
MCALTEASRTVLYEKEIVRFTRAQLSIVTRSYVLKDGQDLTVTNKTAGQRFAASPDTTVSTPDFGTGVLNVP